MKILKTAMRILTRFRLYTTINIIGLTLSLACAMIVIRYIHREVTTDGFCPDLERTCFLVGEFPNRPPRLTGNSNRNRDPNFRDPLDDPCVEIYTSYMPFPEDYLIVDRQHYPVRTLVTDSAFLQVLPYPLLAGSGKLSSPTDAVLTQEIARRIFGSEPPLGKTFTLSTGDVLTITGILGEPDTKTSLSFDMLVSSKLKKRWGRVDYSIARLVTGADVRQLNERNSEYMNLRQNSGVPVRYQLYPMKDFYFNHTIHTWSTSNNMFVQGNYTNILVLAAVAGMLLIVGLFNFVNIYTVMMLRRAREFGVKKVYGAGKWKIFSQIWVENFFTVTIAMLFVWALIEITGGLLESQFSIPSKSDAGFDWLLSVLILVFFPLLTAIHPAVKYFRASPITSLRSVSVGGHSVVSRTVFLFSQYVITFSLIVISSFFVKQLYFMLNADLGYRTKDVIQCRFLSDSSEEGYNADKVKKAEQTRRLINDRLSSCPLFEDYAAGQYPHIIDANFPVKKDDGEYQQAALLFVSQAYMQLFGFQLLEGRMWNDSIDELRQYRMIINESAKRLFEITDITQERLQPGERLWFSSGVEGMDTNPPYEIVGVIKDFKTNHLSKGNIPLIISYNSPWLFDPVIISIVPGKRAEAIAFLQQLYDELIGEGNFQYSFLENEISAMYDEDRRTTRIYVTFAIIAIVISCLGLFGLSLFDIRQRYREIALRKVNGATAGEIFPLLLKKYAYVLSGAFVVAIPLSYLAIHTYLEGFMHRAPVSWYLFAFAAGITALVSYVTLVWQVNKAVRINPAEVIKREL